MQLVALRGEVIRIPSVRCAPLLLFSCISIRGAMSSALAAGLLINIPDPMGKISSNGADSGEAAKNWDGLCEVIHSMIEREGAKIVLSQKLDDVRLAYDIGGFKRATYYLVHFEDEGAAVAPIRRSVRLNESILRVMIVLDEDGPVEINPQLLQAL